MVSDMLPLGLLPAAIVQAWQAAEPDSTDDFAGDCRRYAVYWKLARELLGHLPAKPARNDEQAKAVEIIQQKARDARKLDDAGRAKVSASVAKEVKPIVDALKKTANSSDPIQQHLLWAAKDQLPRLFSADGKEVGTCEAIFQRHMYEAGRRLGIDVSLPPTSVVIQ